MKPKSILLIMDEWEHLEIYENRLKGAYNVYTAPFGAYGIEQAIEKRPDLILIDLSFEDMDEYEAQSLLRNHPDLTMIPIIFTSTPHGKVAIPSEIDVILRHPFVFAALEELLKRLTEFSL